MKHREMIRDVCNKNTVEWPFKRSKIVCKYIVNNSSRIAGDPGWAIYQRHKGKRVHHINKISRARVNIIIEKIDIIIPPYVA